MLTKIRLPVGLLLMVLLGGCAYFDGPDNPEYAPVSPKRSPILPPYMGSIYSQQPVMGNQISVSLYEDVKAHNVGDLITVFLIEKTDATKQAGSVYSKESKETMTGEPTIFGTTAKWKFPKQLPIPLTTTANLGLDTSYDGKTEFTGTGSSNQNNQLRGTITVMVTKIFPNGNLYVRGEKWISLNEGDEYVRLKGIIRPLDVNPDNTIESTRIADARITYSGKGAFADSSKPGWLTRIITSPWWPL